MQRKLLVAELIPERIDDYFRLHETVWPEVAGRYRAAGFRELSLYTLGSTLVLLVEADDFAAAEAALAGDPVDRRWQELVGPMKQLSFEEMSWRWGAKL